MKKVIEYPTDENVSIDTTSEEFKGLFKRVRNNYDLFGPIADYIDIDLYQLFVSKSKNSRFEIMKKSYEMNRKGYFVNYINDNGAIISNDHIERQKTDRNMNWDIDIYLDNNLFSYDIMTNIEFATEIETINRVFTQEAEYELTTEGEYIVAIIYRKVMMVPLILIFSDNDAIFDPIAYYFEKISCYLENYDSSKVEFSNYGLTVKFVTETTTLSPIENINPLSIRDKTKSLVYTLDEEKPIELTDGTLRLLKVYEDEVNGPVSIYQFIDLNGDISHGFYFNSNMHPFSYDESKLIKIDHPESFVDINIIEKDFYSILGDYKYEKEYFSDEDTSFLEAHYSREKEDDKGYYNIIFLFYKIGDNIFYHISEGPRIYIGYGKNGNYQSINQIYNDSTSFRRSAFCSANINNNILIYKSIELYCMLNNNGEVVNDTMQSSLYNTHDYKLRDQYGILSDFNVFLKATGLTFE